MQVLVRTHVYTSAIISKELELLFVSCAVKDSRQQKEKSVSLSQPASFLILLLLKKVVKETFAASPPVLRSVKTVSIYYINKQIYSILPYIIQGEHEKQQAQ